jgi:hypothetical protein
MAGTGRVKSTIGVPEDAIAETARKISDDLRQIWGLRKRGDRSKLRPNEIDVMANQEREVDTLIARRIRSLLLRVQAREKAASVPKDTGGKSELG